MLKVKSLWILSALIIIGSVPQAKALEPEPSLTIIINGHEIVYPRSLLLKCKDAQRMTFEKVPAYHGKTMTFTVIPLRNLFKGLDISPMATIQSKALDGFSAVLTPKNLLNVSNQAAIPYIAIEVPGENWPPLKVDDPATAGPFYLVWANAEKFHVSDEEWPYQLASFEIQKPLQEEFPKIFPKTTDKSVLRGLKLFAKNCFSCHTMNGEGHSQMGPDLNIPMNPTEYLGEKNIRILVRNNQNLRLWPQSKMSHFSKEMLSDKELDDIILYLKTMAQPQNR